LDGGVDAAMLVIWKSSERGLVTLASERAEVLQSKAYVVYAMAKRERENEKRTNRKERINFGEEPGK
jgi:hypothetical protein